ncbi:MAG TPA: aldo/keto reductase [Thermoplasmata archaeon]|nr:aldo/keto reductase [Thermoplasmata archaeon]
MGLVKGRAEPTATASFASRAIERHHFPAGHFRIAPGGLTVSSLGVGTYLGAVDAPTDRAVEEAVGLCLRSGRVNVVDTAINYRFQRAERSVGRALTRAVEAGAVQRQEVFVATKGGYLAPDAESGLSGTDWIDRELIRPGILARRDIVDDSHAMAVGYLEDQYERSRANLGLEQLDLLYLHNAPDAQLPIVGRRTFLERLTEAFGLYERLRKDGGIGAYGLATWDSLRAPRTDPSYLSLEEAVTVAREVGGTDHGFRFIQFPFSLGMSEAAELRNQAVQGERRTLFEAAAQLGLGCFTSVPLLQGQYARSGPEFEGLTRAQTAIQFARSAPGTLAPLVGQKQPAHLSENLRLAELPPWGPEEFRRHLA